MNQYKKLWLAFAAVVIGSFIVLGYYGYEIYRKAPPVPEKVVAADGTLLFSGEDIKDGQNIWQSMGGYNIGSVWGHGAYVAPDWSADWLHREAVYILNDWAQKDYSRSFEELNDEQQAQLKARLQNEIRKNTYDAESKTLTVSHLRAEAIAANSRHYTSLFMGDPALHDLREAYAIPPDTIKDDDRMAKMNSFFFWAAWACVTQRPGQDITYTNNWPPDELVGNQPAGALLLWAGFSVILLIAGIGILAFYHAANRDEHVDVETLPKQDPLRALNPTPSMKATLNIFGWSPL